MTPFLLAGLLGLALVGPRLGTGTAWGEGATDEFQSHYHAAVGLFLSERYAEALKEFQSAYQVRQLPRLLINIGTVHRKLGQAREAIAAYEAYLKVEPNPEPEVKAKLEQCLEQARALLRTAPTDAATPTASAATSASPGPRKPATAARPAERPSPFAPLPAPTDGNIRGLAASGPSDLWLLAERNIHRFDGARWQTAYQGWRRTLTALWGAPEDAASGALWAVGRDGFIVHFDGQRWHEVDSGTPKHLVAIWGKGRERWTLAGDGTVFHLEGTDWIEVPADRPEDLALRAATVLEGGTVLAVGARGAVVRWDGQRLTKPVSGTREDLHGVWAASSRDVWAVGDAGTVLHFDGQRWAPVDVGVKDRVLWGVWGSAPSDVWAVGGSLALVNGGDNLEGSRGVVLHYDGQKWTTVVPETPAALVTVWGSGPKDVYATGTSGALLHYDGESWSELPRRTARPMWALWGRSASDVWAVGEAGTVLRHDGRRWSSTFSRPSESLRALTRGPAGTVWAVGEAGSVLRGGPDGFVRVESGSTRHLNGVWAQGGGEGGGEVFAVGERGTVLRLDGQRFTPLQSPSQRELLAVWGSGPKDVWVAGNATLLHWDGKELAAVTIPDVTNLPETYRRPLRSLWGTGPSDVWVAGEYGLFFHYDGQSWQRVPLKMKTEERFGAVAGSGPKDVWVVASGSSSSPDAPLAFHYDGAAWSSVPLPGFLQSLVVLGPGSVWGAGDRGLLVRLQKRK